VKILAGGLSPVLVVLAVVAIPWSNSMAKTWRVPSESPTICGAVDSTSYGDTVLVAPGTYCRERTKVVPYGCYAWIEMKDGVTLVSEAGPSATTLVESSPGIINFTVYCDSIEGATVRGFTLTEGECPPTQPNAPHFSTGVYSSASDVTVEGNVFSGFYRAVEIYGNPPIQGAPLIKGNDIGDGDCGINISGSSMGYSPLLESNSIHGAKYYGVCSLDSNPHIVGNTVTQCGEAGVYFQGYSSSLMVSNVIINNAGPGIMAIMDYVYESPCLNCGWQKEHANDVYGNRQYDVYYYEETGAGLFEARVNYWGTSCPDSTRFFGRVDWSPWVNTTHTVDCVTCAGCPDAVQPATWGSIKAMFR